MLTEAEAVAAYGDGAVSDELWAEYARERPHVAPSAAAEAAADARAQRGRHRARR